MECRPTVNDVFNYINKIAPFESQCEWDNSGLLVGNGQQKVKKIGVVLDITRKATDFAVENGIDLIVSHHPVIFTPAKNFLSGNPAFSLASNGISAICAHTSLDIAKGGVNDALATVLGFKNISVFSDFGETSMIRIAEIEETDAPHLAKTVANKLSTVAVTADSEKRIRKVAFCGGAGGSFTEQVSAKCDAFITGEAKHHEFLLAKELGLTLIAAGHHETENPVVETLFQKLQSEFNCEICIMPQTSPVKYIY